MPNDALSPRLWQSNLYPELNDGYPWLHWAEANATIRRVQALAEQLDREGLESDRLWNALDSRAPRSPRRR